jgi:hypothetical protein
LRDSGIGEFWNWEIEGFWNSGIGRLRDWKFGIQSAIPEFAIPEFPNLLLGSKGFDSL